MPTDYTPYRRELQRIKERSVDSQLVDLIERLIADLERMASSLRAIDGRVLNIENSRIFRVLQRSAAFLHVWRRRTKLRPQAASVDQKESYRVWMEGEASCEPSRETIAIESERFNYRPTISVLMHVDRPERRWLEQSVASVHGQSWADWELCIADDASPEAWTRELLRQQEVSDSRVRFVRSAERMGAASSLNRAGILSSGDYVAMLDQHDILSPHALFHAVESLQGQRHGVLYCDEDRVDDAGMRRDPLFKPGWSPDLLTSSMYLGRFLVVSRRALDQVDWLRSGFDGGHLYDLALRLAESETAVKHLPKVLLHCGPAGNATSQCKRALEAAIARRGWHAVVGDGVTPGAFQVRRRISGTPLASIVICSKTPRLLEGCLKAIEHRTAYPVREIVVVEHRIDNEAAMDRLLAHSHCMRIPYSGPFDFATMNNAGAQCANGEIVVFMNDDVEPLSADWLKELIAQTQRAETGVAGARLLYPRGAIQHAGVAVGIMDGAGHPNRGSFETVAWPWSRTTRNVSAVTGACMAVRRSVFEELGGFDPAFPVNYNDVDFCLRARRAGYQVIYEPAAVLRHYESGTRPRGTTWHERELFHERWGAMIEHGDPYYNPNLIRTREDCSLVEWSTKIS